MIALLTSLFAACAATSFAAWLVVAQRRLVAGVARRFLRLPRFEQALLVVAVCVTTVCAQKSGTNEVFNAEEEETGSRGEESLVGRDVLGTPNDNGSVIDATLPPRIPPRLRASQNSALKDASRRPPVSLSSARSRPARSSRKVLSLALRPCE